MLEAEEDIKEQQAETKRASDNKKAAAAKKAASSAPALDLLAVADNKYKARCK